MGIRRRLQGSRVDKLLGLCSRRDYLTQADSTFSHRAGCKESQAIRPVKRVAVAPPIRMAPAPSRRTWMRPLRPSLPPCETTERGTASPFHGHVDGRRSAAIIRAAIPSFRACPCGGMVDAADSKSVAFTGVLVQVRPGAPGKSAGARMLAQDSRRGRHRAANQPAPASSGAGIAQTASRPTPKWTIAARFYPGAQRVDGAALGRRGADRRQRAGGPCLAPAAEVARPPERTHHHGARRGLPARRLSGFSRSRQGRRATSRPCDRSAAFRRSGAGRAR